ncbi:hypothetical protein ACF0H5_009271 [Mactra antiquata]
MNRKRQENASVRISDEEYNRLESKFDALKNEFLACRRKLNSKCEALLILSQELDQCRSERDQFKLMAEQLRERYQSIKKSLQPMHSTSDSTVHRHSKDSYSQNLARLLYEAKENNKSLQFEVDDHKQKLHDALGDIKVLREQIARSRVGTTDEGMNTRHFPAHEREALVQKLESSNEQYLQLERDLQTVLDEKEELVTERDVYKTKYERLNQELNYILKGDENRVVDIDALVMENKYLQDRLKQMEEEKCMAMAAVSKYKSLLEKKKTRSSMKLGQTQGRGLVITQKQVQQVLESKTTVLPTPQAMSDLQALAGALLDSVNDKNLALSHQRKTNKILGTRVAELEKKIKTLECAGLWNIPANVSNSLEKLKQDCDGIKTLIPRQLSETDSDRLSPSECDHGSDLETVTPLDSAVTSPLVQSPSHTVKQVNHIELTDLDLLPTKEISTDCKLWDQYDVRDSQPADLPYLPTSSLIAGTTTTLTESDLPNESVNAETDLDVTDENIDVYNADLLDDDKDDHLNCRSKVFDNDDDDDNVDNGDGDDDDDSCEKFKVNDNDDEINEFYDNQDTESVEKVGLLLEKVAQKMCNISNSTVTDDNAGNDYDDENEARKANCVGINEISSVMNGDYKDDELTSESPSDNSPLLNCRSDSCEEKASAAGNIDDCRDVEC